MRRYLFYLFVSLITFVVGIFACFSDDFWKVYKTDRKVFESTEKTVALPKRSAEKAEKNESFERDCYDNEIKPFRDRLDKEAFLRLKRNQAEVSNEDGSASFQAQWARLSEKFTCKRFSDIEQKDLNDDGEEEIFAKGEITSNRSDREIFVFQSENGKLKPILYDVAGSFVEPTEKKFNGFSEIIIKSEHFTYGGRRVNRYRFNGKFYEPIKCVTEYEWETGVNGKTINYKKPRIEVETCDSQKSFFN